LHAGDAAESDGGGFDARRGSQCRLSFDVAAISPEHVSQIERCRRIRWIALHQNAVEALGFGNVSSFFSRLR
jgi:hypothetical protein